MWLLLTVKSLAFSRKPKVNKQTHSTINQSSKTTPSIITSTSKMNSLTIINMSINYGPANQPNANSSKYKCSKKSKKEKNNSLSKEEKPHPQSAITQKDKNFNSMPPKKKNACSSSSSEQKTNPSSMHKPKISPTKSVKHQKKIVIAKYAIPTAMFATQTTAIP